MTKRYLHPTARYSKAVSVNGLSFLSAVYAQNGEGSAEEQMIEVLATIDGYLIELDADRSDIVKTTLFVADLADFSAINGVWDRWVRPGCAPARTPIFGPLLRPQAKVGVEVTIVTDPRAVRR
jgi:enamine deaminase RidA (YjgF/YER057c/UK114 family)